jgi:hypothetical protein
MAGFYRFEEGQRESIRRAKSMLSLNAISRAGDGLPSSADSLLHAKIAAITPRVRLRPRFSARICGKGRELQSTTCSHMSQNSLTVPGPCSSLWLRE